MVAANQCGQNPGDKIIYLLGQNYTLVRVVLTIIVKTSISFGHYKHTFRSRVVMT